MRVMLPPPLLDAVPPPSAPFDDGQAGAATEGVPATAMALIIAAALCHAGWNAAARRVRGDLAVLTVGLGVAMLALALPAALIRPQGALIDAVPYMLGSGAIHVVYLYLIGAMYRHAEGDVSLVYPVARGTGVALTAILSGPLLGERVSAVGSGGIGMVIAGVATIAVSASARRLAREGAAASGGEGDAGQEKADDGGFNVGEVANDGIKAGAGASSTDDSDGKTGALIAADDLVEEADSLSNEPAGNLVTIRRRPRSRVGAIGTAMLCGCAISAYSICDKVGVGHAQPTHYIAGMKLTNTLLLFAFLMSSTERRSSLAAAWRTKRRYCVVVGIGIIGTYQMVLYAMQLASVAYIVAMRELSVLVGALIGVVWLGERPTAALGLGALLVGGGLLCIKIGG